MADVAQARAAMEEARIAVGDTKALCDIITAQGLDSKVKYQFENWATDRATIQKHAMRHKAMEALVGLKAFHFPVAFPEVFLRRRPGFNVILGNPPWQEATIEDHNFWARHFPGLRGLQQADLERERKRLRNARPDLETQLEAEIEEMARTRKSLTSGAYPGMGTGDPDFYKAFAWRFWRLVSEDGGRIGVVLPRGAFSAKGSTQLRAVALGQSASFDVSFLLNKKHWVFDEVHEQYLITLAWTAIARGKANGNTVKIAGPYSDLADFEKLKSTTIVTFTADEVLSWSDAAALPLLSAERSIEVFARLRNAPRLDLNVAKEWRARPDTEMHATSQKKSNEICEDLPLEGFWPVFKGESFNLWEPDQGIETYYAWADPKPGTLWIYRKRLKSGKGKRDSAHAEFPLSFRQDQKTLSCYRPRITFRRWD